MKAKDFLNVDKIITYRTNGKNFLNEREAQEYITEKYLRDELEIQQQYIDKLNDNKDLLFAFLLAHCTTDDLRSMKFDIENLLGYGGRG